VRRAICHSLLSFDGSVLTDGTLQDVDVPETQDLHLNTFSCLYHSSLSILLSYAQIVFFVFQTKKLI
jgi:hypothetical protein